MHRDTVHSCEGTHEKVLACSEESVKRSGATKVILMNAIIGLVRNSGNASDDYKTDQQG